MGKCYECGLERGDGVGCRVCGAHTLPEQLRLLYTDWNNPPSPELPEGAGLVLVAADRIAELEALVQVSRELNKSYVHALRSIANYRFAIEINDTDEEAIAAYSGAVQRIRLIARQALPITE